MKGHNECLCKWYIFSFFWTVLILPLFAGHFCWLIGFVCFWFCLLDSLLSFSLLFLIPFFFGGGGGGGVGAEGGMKSSNEDWTLIFSFLIVNFLLLYSYYGCDYLWSFSQFHQSLDAGPDVFVCRCCMPWFEGWIPLFSSQPTDFIQPGVPSPPLWYQICFHQCPCEI